MLGKTIKTAVLAATAFSITGALLAQTSWKRVSFFTFNWNGHMGVQVIFEIPTTLSDPGDFTRVRIRVPGQKEFFVTNDNGWVKYGSEEASASPVVLKMENCVQSKYVLALKATDERTLLFLLGYSYASSPGSLDVLDLSDDGRPRIALHRDELGLLELRDLDGDGITEIVGYPCLSQEFGNGLHPRGHKPAAGRGQRHEQRGGNHHHAHPQSLIGEGDVIARDVQRHDRRNRELLHRVDLHGV